MLRMISNASVVGVARSQFESNGQTVYGYSISFTYPLTSEGSEGSGVGSVWISKRSFDSLYLSIGSAINVARVRSGDRIKFELVS